jgi:hypothetical protein
MITHDFCPLSPNSDTLAKRGKQGTRDGGPGFRNIEDGAVGDFTIESFEDGLTSLGKTDRSTCGAATLQEHHELIGAGDAGRLTSAQHQAETAAIDADDFSRDLPDITDSQGDPVTDHRAGRSRDACPADGQIDQFTPALTGAGQLESARQAHGHAAMPATLMGLPFGFEVLGKQKRTSRDE